MFGSNFARACLIPTLFTTFSRSISRTCRCLMAAGEPPAKSLKTMVKIGTHSGTFHCDEVLACFMLKKLPEYKNGEIIRTRDEKKLADCDIVVDVGGIYDPKKHRYDHHQKSFNETMNSLNRDRPWTTRLSSAGLVYHHFGHRVLGEIVGKKPDDRVVAMLYNKVYENLVEEVDAVDNGINQCADKPRYAVTTTLASRVRHFIPAWNEPEKNTDEHFDKQFAKAVDYVGAEFTDRVQFYVKSWWPARAIIEEALAKRYEVDGSGEVISLGNGGCPWKDHLFELESETGTKPPIIYVLYQDGNSTWRIQCVPQSLSSFENRLSLPEKWRGLRDAELSKVAGIEGCTFVHVNGFIGGNQTYDGVLQMARAALKSPRA